MMRGFDFSANLEIFLASSIGEQKLSETTLYPLELEESPGDRWEIFAKFWLRSKFKLKNYFPG